MMTTLISDSGIGAASRFAGAGLPWDRNSDLLRRVDHQSGDLADLRSSRTVVSPIVMVSFGLMSAASFGTAASDVVRIARSLAAS